MRALLIHGRSQQDKDPVGLKEAWLDALRSGFDANGSTWPGDDRFDFPYYGDVLADLVQRNDLPSARDVVEKGESAETSFERFVAEYYLELQSSHPALDEAEIRDAFPVHEAVDKGPQNWRWVRAIARFVDLRFGAATEFTIERFLADVYLYISNRYVARQVDELVRSELTADPTIVVGHSLGSIVSYKLTVEMALKGNLVRHITLGSPLGINAISSRLGVPENLAINGWFNAFDPDDIVALHPLDGEHFPTEPVIDNDATIVNPTSNQHGIEGYLSSPSVAQQISAAFSL